jgi:hypothetical protein
MPLVVVPYAPSPCTAPADSLREVRIHCPAKRRYAQGGRDSRVTVGPRVSDVSSRDLVVMRWHTLCCVPSVGLREALPLVVGVLAGCECPPNATTIENGEAGAGVIPYDAVAPLVGTHTATLQWVIPNRTTTFRMTVQSPPGIIEYTDCENRDPSFDATFTASATTDDGVLNLTGGTELAWNAGSSPEAPMLPWYPSFDALKDAGVTPAWAVEGFDVQFAVQTTGADFQPQNSQMVMVGPPNPPTLLATIEFNP